MSHRVWEAQEVGTSAPTSCQAGYNILTDTCSAACRNDKCGEGQPAGRHSQTAQRCFSALGGQRASEQPEARGKSCSRGCNCWTGLCRLKVNWPCPCICWDVSIDGFHAFQTVSHMRIYGKLVKMQVLI